MGHRYCVFCKSLVKTVLTEGTYPMRLAKCTNIKCRGQIQYDVLAPPQNEAKVVSTIMNGFVRNAFDQIENRRKK